MKKFNFDVILVGNGILALTTAYFLKLKAPRLKIALIGKSDRLGGATQAAGAMFNCFGEVTPYTFTSPFSYAKFQWAFDALKRWPSFLEALSEGKKESLQGDKGGTHIVLNSHNGGLDDENFLAIIKALSEKKMQFHEVDPQSISGLAPEPDFRPLRALHIPEEGHINPCKVMQRLEEILSKSNCEFFDAEAIELKREGKGSFSCRLSNQLTLSGEQIVIAAGSQSQIFVEQFPEIVSRIPHLLSSVGCAMVVKADDVHLTSVVRTPTRAGSCGFHMMNYQPGLIYIGATAFFNKRRETEAKIRYSYNLVKNAIYQFNQNFQNACIEKTLVGNRPVTIDGFPLVGKTSIPGLWLLTGTYRDGFHNAPLLGDYISGEMLGMNMGLVNPFSPERKAIEVLKKEEAIDRAVKELLASNYEYGMLLPMQGIGFEEIYAKGLREKIKEIYQVLEVDIGLSVEMICLFLRADQTTLLEFREIYRKNLGYWGPKLAA